LLQRKRKDAFSFGCLDFEYEDRVSVSCNMIYYTVRFGGVAQPVIIKCVDCMNWCETNGLIMPI